MLLICYIVSSRDLNHIRYFKFKRNAKHSIQQLVESFHTLSSSRYNCAGSKFVTGSKIEGRDNEAGSVAGFR